MSQLKKDKIDQTKQAIINYLDCELDAQKVDLTQLTANAIYNGISKQQGITPLKVDELNDILEDMTDKKTQDLKSRTAEITIFYPPARAEKI